MVVLVDYSRLNTILKQRNIKKYQMLSSLGLTRSIGAKITNGKRLPPIAIAKICEYLNCSVEQILSVVKSDHKSFNMNGRKSCNYQFSVEKDENGAFIYTMK